MLNGQRHNCLFSSDVPVITRADARAPVSAMMRLAAACAWGPTDYRDCTDWGDAVEVDNSRYEGPDYAGILRTCRISRVATGRMS